MLLKNVHNDSTPNLGTGQEEGANPSTIRKHICYNILTASGGEEAVEIVRNELASGRRITTAFVDMVMPGGIDGRATIKKLLQLDNQILCAIVTGHTDHCLEHIGRLFERQDNWLYFNKPFSIESLRQTAYHLVSSWNRRRMEEALISNMEMMQNGLIHILESVSNLNEIPPLMFDNILKAILTHFLKLVDSGDGFILLGNEAMPRQLGVGVFKGHHDFSTSEFQREWAMAENAMKQKVSIIEDTMAASPLIIGEEVLGVLFIQRHEGIEQDSKLLDILALQAVNMIRHSQLYKELELRNLELDKKNKEFLELLGKLSQSEKIKSQFEKLTYLDVLTGIPNRRYLEIRFREEIARAQRYGFPMACLMIDIDNFKKINDTYGHAAGDYVLQELGKLFLQCKRSYDVVGRYGGEEFVMIFQLITEDETLRVSERLRCTVEKHKFIFEGKKLHIRISIGITALKPSSEDVMESILKTADKALYQAKDSGRNRCVYTPKRN